MPPPPGRRPAGKRPPPAVEATRLESDEEIREAIRARAAQRQGKAPAGPAVPVAKLVAAAPQAEPEPETPAEKPQQRPPMALLCVLDDGKHDGEWVRLRADRYVIGRADGDVRIGHDPQMSGRHAEIVRQKTKEGGYRWLLVDLGSTNGTWVRVGRTALNDGSEILVGGGQYLFQSGSDEAPTAPIGPAGSTVAYVMGQGGQTAAAAVPSLLEVTPAGPGRRYPLTQAEYWIGRDARSCAIARPDDPSASPRHARLSRDARGQWHVENNESVNGLWLRVDEVPLGATCQFRMGEQRFLFRVL